MTANGAKTRPSPPSPRVAEDAADESVPTYEARLSARHSVFADGFRKIVCRCPAGAHALDVGCGDGFFLEELNRAGRWRRVTGLDPSPAFLALARTRKSVGDSGGLVQGVGEMLPYADKTFDLVWSAHSMQSYPDVEATINEAYRVLKRGGTLAILENDRLHARMLPLSPAVDAELMAKRVAELSEETSGNVFYARWCERYLEAAGFTSIQRSTCVLERQSPWDETTQHFYALILEETLREARRLLHGPLLIEAEDALSPHSPNYLGNQAGRYFCELHTLLLALK